MTSEVSPVVLGAVYLPELTARERSVWRSAGDVAGYGAEAT